MSGFPFRLPTPEELEIINRPLTKAEATGVCKTRDLCFEFNEWVRCGPCSLAIAARPGASRLYVQSIKGEDHGK